MLEMLYKMKWIRVGCREGVEKMKKKKKKKCSLRAAVAS